MTRYGLGEQPHAGYGTEVLPQLTCRLNRYMSHPPVSALLLVRSTRVPDGQIAGLRMPGHLPAAIVPVERPAPADDLGQFLEILLVAYLQHDDFHGHPSLSMW